MSACHLPQLMNWHLNPSFALSPAKLNYLHPISATSVEAVVVRRMKPNCLKLSQLATKWYLSALRGSGSHSSVSHPSNQAGSTQNAKEPLCECTLTMVHATLTTNKLNNLHRIPNLQVDLSHFFNSQCKNNTHFPLTYYIECLNLYRKTINCPCYHSLLKLHHEVKGIFHSVLSYLGTKKIYLGWKVQVEVATVSLLLPKPFFSWNSKMYYILVIKIYIECSRTVSIS